ncbi:hypothetical protein vBPaeMUSP18_24 [Pseudomonas phage vB_PaeM_USP_18]|nr:hypothetical protein vBPaeMUSP18_24 [Pseudomonas phage vB_PaeM_USP_18]
MPLHAVPLNADWVGAGAYRGGFGRADGSWGLGDRQQVAAPGIHSPGAGLPALKWEQFAAPSAIEGLELGASWVTHPSDYQRRQFVVDGEWAGAGPYTGTIGFVRGSWSGQIVISPGGFASSEFAEPLIFSSQFVAPAGVDSLATAGQHYALFSWQYAPPQWRLDASWVGRDSYAPPAAATTDGAWSLPSESKQVSLTGWDGLALGFPSLERMLGILSPTGIQPVEIPSHTVANLAAPIRPSGFNAQAFGAAEAWNWRRYVGGRGFVASLYGVAYAQGGVKEIAPKGLIPPPLGTINVINTTADQQAQPKGIAAPPLGAPGVSPRTVWPSGVYGTGAGFPRVQFPPQPAGWQSSTFGYAVVEYKTKLAAPVGIDGFSTGFPAIRDRAITIQHHASPVTALFGDVLVRTLNQALRVQGFDSFIAGDWSEVRSTRRWLVVEGRALSEYGHAAIRNKTPSFAPAGWESLDWGGPDVGWRIRSVTPSGIATPFQQVAQPSLWQTPSLKPAGLAAPAVPSPYIWDARRYVLARGADLSAVGSPTVGFTWRRLTLEGRGVAGAAYGRPWLSHWTRNLPVLGADYLRAGVPWVTPGVRYVEPVAIPEIYMSRHQVGGTRYLGPEGFDAVRWLTRIIPESQEIFPKTFGASYGAPRVIHRTVYLLPLGITTYPEEFMHWGVARAWNLRQIITQNEAEESELRPLPWSQWTLVENRNRPVRAAGFVAGRYGSALVTNAARPVYGIGIPYPALPGYYQAGSVTHAQRWLTLDGIEPPPISRWAVAHNKAVPLLASGYVASAFGTAGVVNLRRFYQAQGWAADVFGYAFVADAIRTLTFEGRYGIQPPVIAMPSVYLSTRYVEPPPIATDQSKLGLPILITHRNEIIPRWSHSDRVGTEIRVRNVTPEVMTKGRNSEEFGDAFTRLEWRPVDAHGTSMQLFGSARIADRRQSIAVAGRNFMAIGDKITVRRIGQDPVVTQRIDLRVFIIGADDIQREADEGYGIAAPRPAAGVPNLLKGYIFHGIPFGDAHNMLRMGQPYVTANTIRVEPGYGELLVSEPVVTLRVRTLEASTLEDTEIKLGKPRLSPHTIYAVLEASDQAIRNHDMHLQRLHPVNDGARFGRPSLTLYRGLISPRSIGPTSPIGTWGVGRPTAYNLRRYVKAAGSNMARMGWATIPGVQSVLLEEPVESVSWGRPSLTRPPYVGPQTVRANAIVPPPPSSPVVDFFNRAVRASGFLAQAMGASGQGSTTNMPQRLYVGPRKPNIPHGFVASDYGTPWVSYRVRGLSAEGFESFLSEYDFQNFKHRMRVTRTEIPKPRLTIAPEGFAALETGAPDLLLGVHYIRPDGNADQYRKGAF